MPTTHADRDDRRASALELAGLVLLLGGGAAVLYALSGPPHPPPSLPTWGTVLATLRGSDVPVGTLVYMLTTAAWAVWLWIVGTTALHGAAVLGERLSDGAAWARRLRALSERVTAPAVRRVVEGAVATAFFVSVAARPLPAAAGSPLPPAAVAAAAARPPGAETPAPPRPDPAEGRGDARYTVQQGDNLWAISSRFYGDGAAYRRIVAANAGRRMPDGRTFDQSGVIHPGWVLDLPLAGGPIEEREGRRYYVVQEGDTLRAIAERLLGDEMRWPRIYELNCGVARLDDGRVLTDPDLIWPGLRLLLPGGAPPSAPIARAPDREDQTLRRPAPAPPAPAPLPIAPPPAPAVPAPPPAPARAPEPLPTAPPTPVVEPAPAPAPNGLPTVVYAAAGLVAAGGAALVARRRFRRSLDEPPVPDEPLGDAVVRSGFAEADPALLLAQRLQGGAAEPAALLADRALRFLAERGLGAVAIVTVQQGRRAAELVLEAGVADQEKLLGLARPFAAGLGADGRAEVTRDNDVRWRLSGFQSADLLPAPGGASALPCLLPLAALPSRETLHAGWSQMGHALVAGVPNGGTETVLTSLVAALTARRSPEGLRLWTIAGRQTLPDRLASLPHQVAPPVDPGDLDRAAAVLDGLLRELTRRKHSPREGAEPELVLVVAELAGLNAGTALERIGLDGAAHGLRVLAATTRPREVDDATLAHFRTRLVLRTQTEEESVRLLDEPRAAELGDGGDLLLRVDARAPVHGRGFRVAADHLDRLVELMRRAYPTPPAAPEAAIGDEAPAAPADDPPTDAEVVVTAGHGPEESARESDTTEAAGVESVAEPPTVNGSHPTALSALLEEAPAEGTGAIAAEHTNGHLPEQLPLLASEVSAVGSNGQNGGRAAPVQVLCFGGPRVLVDGREVWPAGETGGHQKPWDVLVYLAAQPTPRATRGKILEAIWGDAGAEDRGQRVKNAIYHLRRMLAAQLPGLKSDVVLTGTVGVVALDTKVVASDVQVFLACCRRAASPEPAEAIAACRDARALYRGDLLTGRSYEWVEEREDGPNARERYRAVHRKVTGRLADLCRRAGDVEEAIELYREILRAEPLLEDVVRALYRCHHRLGDRAGLLREERQLRQALKEAYYAADGPGEDPALYEPSPETVALFERLSADLEARQQATAR